MFKVRSPTHRSYSTGEQVARRSGIKAKSSSNYLVNEDDVFAEAWRLVDEDVMTPKAPLLRRVHESSEPDVRNRSGSESRLDDSSVDLSRRRRRRRRRRSFFLVSSLVAASVFAGAVIRDMSLEFERARRRCPRVRVRQPPWREPLKPYANAANKTRHSDLRFWGSHNSYHRRPLALAFPYFGALVPAWDFSLQTLASQLDDGARHLELDVHLDIFARTVSVFHVPSIDARTRCYCLHTCVAELLAWSKKRQRRHSLVFVLLEPKGARYVFEDLTSHLRGFGTDTATTAKALGLLDDALFEAFADSPDSLLTPADIAQAPETLAATVAAKGWPPHDALTGRFAFCLLDSNKDERLTLAYSGRRSSHPRGRAMFAMANDFAVDTARPDVAVFKLDTPILDVETIQHAVRRGFIVRTRANTMQQPHDATRFRLAHASGAQLISFEPDAHANWRKFIGDSGDNAADHFCACNDVALQLPSSPFLSSRVPSASRSAAYVRRDDDAYSTSQQHDGAVARSGRTCNARFPPCF